MEKPEPIVRAEDSAEKSHRVPRTSLTAEALRTLDPAPRRAPTVPPSNGGPLGLRATPEPIYFDRAGGTPSPSSAYAPRSVYARREYESPRQIDQGNGTQRGGRGDDRGGSYRSRDW